MRTPQTDRLLDAESAAALLGIKASTIRDWWSLGKLRRVKIGRLTRVWESEILALIPHEEKGQPEKTDPAKHARQTGAANDNAAPPPKDTK